MEIEPKRDGPLTAFPIAWLEHDGRLSLFWSDGQCVVLDAALHAEACDER
jgi:hypothetical protein